MLIYFFLNPKYIYIYTLPFLHTHKTISLTLLQKIKQSMRMSCNGCRVLRKGCSEGCTIRPCLEWIKSSDSQANATLFLAKFYGRAGLLNLIESGPEHLRPAIFRSLLYEACGRVINPVYGSIGMLWSGNWAQCQAAVEAVLKGNPITQPSSSSSSSMELLVQQQQQQQQPISPLKTYDIRHVSKDPNTMVVDRVQNRTRFKRSVKRSTRPTAVGDNTKEDENMFSVETAEASLAIGFPKLGSQAEETTGNVGLELTLALPLN